MRAFRGARRRASRTAGCIAAAIAAAGPAVPPALGQVPGTPSITSSGLNTQVISSPVDGGTKYSIKGGTASGSNLFHSFGLFNLPNAADIAEFVKEGGRRTTDIVARVNGAQRSSIFGTIRTSGFGSANLFLINPSGWMFGSTAELDVRGSFHASTAHQVVFGDAVFDASTVEAQAVLMSAPPSAFGFLGPTGSISVEESALTVDRGKTLSLIGGDVTVQGGTLTAPGGRIQIGGFAAEGQAAVDGLEGAFASLGRVEISGGASVSAAGSVLFDALGIPSVVKGGTALIRGGEVAIAGALVDVSGVQGADDLGNPLLSAGGTVVIRGGRLFMDASAVMAQTHGNASGSQAAIDVAMDDSISLKNGAQLLTATSGTARGGDILLIAGSAAGAISFQSANGAASQMTGHGDVALEAGSVAIDDATVATVSNSEEGEGVGGDVTLRGGVVALTGGASVQSINHRTTRDSRGGNITVRADDSVLISGRNASGGFSQLVSVTDAAGDGGRILIEADSLSMQSGTAIISQASLVVADGKGGNVLIDVGRLSLTGGATINSVNLSEAPPLGGSFRGGDVMVSATREVEISGSNGGIFSIAFGAQPGDIALNAGTLRLTDGALIQGGRPFLSGDPPSYGGNVTVSALDSILIAGRAGISSQAVDIDVGRVAVSARSLTINQGFINASTLGVGKAGDILIDVGTLTLAEGGQIWSSSLDVVGAGDGRGGTVTVVATGAVDVSGSAPGAEPLLPEPFRGFIQERASGIFSTSQSDGPAGSIAVSTPALRLADGGKLSVETTGAGDAGRVMLNVDAMTMTSGAQIASSTSSTGDAGGISINAGTVSVDRSARIDSGTSSSGRGGTIALRATGLLSLGGGAGLFSGARGTGAGGDIEVTAGQIELLGGSTISASSTGSAAALAGTIDIIFGDSLLMRESSIATESEEAGGGAISILATGSIHQMFDGRITTSVRSGAQGAGDITIGSHDHPIDFLVLFDSAIQANAFRGPGGNIGIFADVYLTSGSLVTASSALSTPGTISVEARITDLSGSLAQLPDDTLQAATLLRAACAARVSEGQASSLVVAGRDGVPPAPEGLLWSPLAAALAEPDLARGAQRDSEPFPRFTPMWLSFDCAR